MRNERSTLSGSADSSISARRSPPASSSPCATGKIFSTGFQSSTHLPTTRSELTSAGNDSLRGTKTPAGNRNGNSRTFAKDGLRIGRCDPKKSEYEAVLNQWQIPSPRKHQLATGTSPEWFFARNLSAPAPLSELLLASFGFHCCQKAHAGPHLQPEPDCCAGSWRL